MDTIRNGRGAWGLRACTTGTLYYAHTLSPCLSGWGRDEDQLGPLNTTPKGLIRVESDLILRVLEDRESPNR